MVDFDSDTLFNGAAAIVATIAVVVFVVDVEFGYSPVSKFALVVLFLAGVFALTQRTSDHQLTLLGYGVVVVSAVALFVETVNTFDVGNALTVAGLLAVAAVLFWVRTRVDENDRFTTGRQATLALVVVAALVAGILVVDVASGGPAYELRSQSEVTVPDSDRNQLRVASVVVTNPTPLPERVDAPNYAVCPAGDWSAHRRSTDSGERQRPVHAHLNVRDGYNEHVLSFSEKTYPVGLYLDGANLTGETFPIQRTDACPESETGAPFLAVYEAPDDRPSARPV